MFERTFIKQVQNISLLGSVTLSSELRILADNPTGIFKVLQPRIRGMEYNIAHYGDHWYLNQQRRCLILNHDYARRKDHC